jgi:hypothetical protein
MGVELRELMLLAGRWEEKLELPVSCPFTFAPFPVRREASKSSVAMSG